MLDSKTRLLIAIAFFILLILGGVYLLTNRSQVVKETATNFEECVSLGFPVMESYPRQCMDADGNHFTENIGNTLEKQDKIILDSPRPNEKIKSPVTLKGTAKGWYFEASFPVFVVDWDGKIIGQGIAQAQGDWMTSDFVPFVATVEFTVDPNIYSKKGGLILKKDNPSGLPEHDDALEIPVVFE